MLGEEARGTYLVLFQNNAEIRATGGAARRPSTFG